MANYSRELWIRADIRRKEKVKRVIEFCHMQVHLSGNNVPTLKPPPNHTTPSSTAATFLATCLMAVLQPSRYSIFHSGDTPIQLSLP